MRKRVLTRALGDPESLVELVAARLEEPRPSIVRLLGDGAIHVDGKRATSDRKLGTGAKIVIFLDGSSKQASAFRVIYEDEAIIVVDKPAGMPSQAERSQRAGALDAQLQQAISPSTRLIHRLDKEASGLVLVARRPDVCAPLQTALTAGEIERIYVALVDGELRGEGSIRLKIGRHARDSRLRAALPENAPAGEAACSHWRALAQARLGERAITAVELRLETGRTHQLRVHLSAIGHPIVGDAPYGGPPFERLCLHARRLELRHPVRRDRLRCEAPLPPAFEELVPGLTRLSA
jgi:23S rRNA pseudouridine1911/1915/1917 synthase